MDPAVIHSLTGLLVPLGGMVSLIAIIVLVLDYRHRRAQQLHDTVTRLAEKGLPVPPELLTPPVPKSRLRGALTLIGLGVGLIALFIAQGDYSNWGVGAVPLAIGLAQLVAWKLENPQTAKPPGA
jgi:hypothetical protein